MRGFIIASSVVVLVACRGATDPPDAPLDGSGFLPGVAAGIDAGTLLAEIERLASDEFEGRAPGSVGETRTVEYLIGQFSALGREPGNPDGTWVQQVPLVGITPVTGAILAVSRDGDTRALQPGTDYVAYTKRVVDEGELDAEFVFVGYGAVAPEYDWNDLGEIPLVGCKDGDF